MENNVSRILIETIVRKTLKDIKESPERSTRNLVDMALHVSKSRFQRNFFQAAQKMLQNEQSPYYALIQNIAMNVDHEKLLTFGINLGYNSCTLGAKKIREIEAREHYNIPWCISLQLDMTSFAQHQQQYQMLIAEGKTLGIHTWLLFVEDQPQEAMSLVFDHPDCAFFLFCYPQYLTRSFAEQASEANNVMLVVNCEEDIMEECIMFRQRGLLYSVYAQYGDADVDSITSGAWLDRVESLGGIFTALLPTADCSVGSREAVHAYMESARNEQLYQTLPMEVTRDCSYVDSIISDEECTAIFDAQGQLIAKDQRLNDPCFCVFKHSLQDVLRCAFPKRRKEVE